MLILSNILMVIIGYFLQWMVSLHELKHVNGPLIDKEMPGFQTEPITCIMTTSVVLILWLLFVVAAIVATIHFQWYWHHKLLVWLVDMIDLEVLKALFAPSGFATVFFVLGVWANRL